MKTRVIDISPANVCDEKLAVGARVRTRNTINIIVRKNHLSTLATASGILALVLAPVGLYGLLAHAVAQRTSEIGRS